jgi:cation diffusion facilitator CzcD-associated flavoprotein CzcO
MSDDVPRQAADLDARVRPLSQVPNRPLHTERPLRIIALGAGASGLCFAYKLQRSFETFELRIYEKNPDISGTWFENRYPGCACDIPSHNYTW